MAYRSILLLAALAACRGDDQTDKPDDTLSTEQPVTNRPPGAPDIKISPSRPTSGDDLEVDIVFDAVDPDGDDVTYEFVWLRDGDVMRGLEDDTVPAEETSKGEEWEVRVRASDRWVAGETADDEVEIGNGAPSVNPEWIDDPAGDLLVSADAEDPDGDDLDVTFIWKRNGQVEPYDTKRVPASAAIRGDTWVVQVTASDGELSSDTVRLTQDIPNSLPSISVEFASAPTVCDPLICVVHAPTADADGDPVSVSVRWKRNGVAWAGTTTTTTLADDTIPAHEMTAGEVWTCTAVASDGLDTVRVDAITTVNGSRISERFELQSPSQVDILLIVDDSGSMEEEQARLGTQLGALLEGLVTWGIDWHLGLVTTDTVVGEGRLVEERGARWLTSATPNLADAYGRLVNVGTAGSPDERGRRAAELALTPPLSTGYNAGFIRPNANLALIVLSDEEDQSRNNPTLTDFISFLQSFKPDPEMVSFHALVGPSGGCTTLAGTAEYGAEYSAVRAAMGGYEASICLADWRPFLSATADYVAGAQRYFELSRQPSGAVVGTWTHPNGSTSPLIQGQDFTLADRVVAVVAELEPGATVEFDYDYTCE